MSAGGGGGVPRVRVLGGGHAHAQHLPHAADPARQHAEAQQRVQRHEATWH